MSTSSPSTDARARKNESIFRNAIAQVGQNRIAQEIGVSPTTLSRYCSEEDALERACKIMAAAGVKCVPIAYECYPRQDIEAIFTLAQRSLRGMSSVDQLRWDE
ncbi:hypothetical protein [Robbsia andropogonis]|uniref:hypothetical protein n=1 Tax=Robbsia andropogonis TaxID=28092 RepID=UPI002A6B8619|nr:hypothetical protein [Robbsia andropogonis]